MQNVKEQVSSTVIFLAKRIMNRKELTYIYIYMYNISINISLKL